MVDKDRIMEEIVPACKKVMDPEIPVDIYELGLIYSFDVDDEGVVNMEMTLTTPMCPVAGELPIHVKRSVMKIEGVTEVEVHVVFEPPWDPSKMSEEAALVLDMM